MIYKENTLIDYDTAISIIKTREEISKRYLIFKFMVIINKNADFTVNAMELFSDHGNQKFIKRMCIVYNNRDSYFYSLIFSIINFYSYIEWKKNETIEIRIFNKIKQGINWLNKPSMW